MSEPTWPQAQPPQQPGPKRLTRSRDDKMLGGVCGGIARYTNVDANLIRLVAVVGLLLGAGSLGLAYLIAWALMPEE